MDNRCQKHKNWISESNCSSNAFEEMNITVPVAVRGFADVGNVEFKCMGPSVITRNCDRTPGNPCAVSKFTVSQRLRVDIPIDFGAKADVGEGHVEFNDSDRCRCAN